MVQVNELRKFNIVYLEGGLLTVKEIREHDATFSETDAAVEYEDLDPVELSPEILQACGFINENGIVGQYSVTVGRFTFSVYEGRDNFSIQEKAPKNMLAKGIDNLTIQHLHQLQNIVFFLTGIELSINLEKVKQ